MRVCVCVRGFPRGGGEWTQVCVCVRALPRGGGRRRLYVRMEKTLIPQTRNSRRQAMVVISIRLMGSNATVLHPSPSPIPTSEGRLSRSPATLPFTLPPTLRWVLRILRLSIQMSVLAHKHVNVPVAVSMPSQPNRWRERSHERVRWSATYTRL